MVKKIKVCKKCFYRSDHPLGITFNSDGICSGCLIHEEKYNLDWKNRFELLKNNIKEYKLISTKNNYDCIVPVSGANDSYFILHIVKNILKLNPLLVSHNKYFNTPIGIANLTNLRTQFNCDIIIQNINPLTIKKITRETLRRFGNIYWPCIAGQTVFPVQTAARFKIPLIIWGAHQGVEQVGMFSHTHEVEMTRRYRHDHDLFGYEADDLITTFNTLNESDIWQFRYPDDHKINEIGIRGIYLSNYIPWDPKKQHELMIKKYNYRSTTFERTFDTYDYVDCYNYMGIHDYLKLLKHGYSKVVDHATREIRHRRLTKFQAIKLINKFMYNKPTYTKIFSDWLGIDSTSLEYMLEQFRNLELWHLDGNTKEFKLKKELSNKLFLNKYENIVEIKSDFISTDLINLEMDENYITIGKGC